MHAYQNLRVWQRARELVVRTYEVTSRFPQSEQFGLTSQMRRAATSIVANVAEGAGRGTNRDFGRFVWIATGSAFEYEAHVTVAHDLSLLTETATRELLADIGVIKRMLHGLGTKLYE